MDLAFEAVQQNARWEERQREARNRIDINMMTDSDCKKHASGGDATRVDFFSTQQALFRATKNIKKENL